MSLNKSTFLIISVFDQGAHPPGAPTYEEISKITSKSIISYCEANDYNYLITDEFNKSRAASWGKIDLAIKHLQDFSYIWTFDSDLMIMNQNIKLESIVDQDHDVFFTCYKNDIKHLNTGSIIYRNTPWTQKFLREIWNDPEFAEPRPNCFFEQSAIIKYYNNNPNESSHFKFLPTRSINSHYHPLMKDREWNVNYEHGDLVVHLAGLNNGYRYKEFPNFEKWIIRYNGIIRHNFFVREYEIR
jgi:hypothetical protein